MSNSNTEQGKQIQWLKPPNKNDVTVTEAVRIWSRYSRMIMRDDEGSAGS